MLRHTLPPTTLQAARDLCQAARPSHLRERFASLRRAGRARHRDIAASLEVSEGELIAAHAGTFDPHQSPLAAVPLRAEWPRIVAALEPLGELMALTRNPSCVHEKVGVYRHCSSGGPGGHVGLVLGGEIDLRVFYSQWAHGFAVEEQLDQGGTQRSLQFFDAQGEAVHKAFLRDASDLTAYAALVRRFCQTQQSADFIAPAGLAAATERPDAAIDAAGFRQAWASMRDTHEFFGLLERFGVTRTQALRLAPPEFAQSVDADSAHPILSRAAQDGVPIMVFVGNPGMIQIHSGTVRRVEVMGPWLNVLDPGFNLHLREDHVASAWLVRKPTLDGMVSSLELFDVEGRTIAMFFGERKPGRSELCEWRELLNDLTHEGQRCAAC